MSNITPIICDLRSLNVFLSLGTYFNPMFCSVLLCAGCGEFGPRRPFVGPYSPTYEGDAYRHRLRMRADPRLRDSHQPLPGKRRGLRGEDQALLAGGLPGALSHCYLRPNANREQNLLPHRYTTVAVFPPSTCPFSLFSLRTPAAGSKTNS